MVRHEMMITYAQIAVFDSGRETPFNDWTAAHVAQGFAWREASVSFRTLIDAGELDVAFVTADRFAARPDSQRTISVPFVCTSPEGVEIGAIT